MLGLAVFALTSLFHSCQGNVFELEVGDCFNTRPEVATGEAHVRQVELTACDGPYEHEVYALVTLPDSTWPGEAAISDAADAACRSAARTTLSASDDAATTIAFLHPTEDSWKNLDDRDLVCFVVVQP